MHCILAKKLLGKMVAILENYTQNVGLFFLHVCVCLGLIKIHTGSCIKMLAKVLQMVTFQIYLISATRNRVNTDVLPPKECLGLSSIKNVAIGRTHTTEICPTFHVNLSFQQREILPSVYIQNTKELSKPLICC